MTLTTGSAAMEYTIPAFFSNWLGVLNIKPGRGPCKDGMASGTIGSKYACMEGWVGMA